MPSLSDLSPQEWLHHQRVIAGYNNSPFISDKAWEHHIIAQFPREGSRLIERFGRLNQFDIDDILIQIYLKTLRLSDEECAEVDKIYFGVFPTFDVDAYLKKTPRGDDIVLIHAGLIKSVMLWSYIFTYQMKGDFDTFLANHPYEFAELLVNIGRLWKKELEIIDIQHPFLFTMDDELWLLSAQLTYSCMSFILGHEIGHILERHHGYTKSQHYNHTMEYTADEWGLKICARHIVFNGALMPRHLSRIMMLGPHLALSMIATIYDIQSNMHPSASKRVERISAKFENIFLNIIGEEGIEMYKEELGKDVFTRTASIGGKMFQQHTVYSDIINDISERVTALKR